VRNDFVRPVKTQMLEFCGGQLPKLLFWSLLVYGKCVT